MSQPDTQDARLGYITPRRTGCPHTLGMSRRWQDNARPAMLAQGIKQQHIADRLGKDKSAVSHWFKGRHNPSLHELREIAKMLHLSLPELLEGDETFVRDELELHILRQVRAVDPDRRDHAKALIDAVLSTIGDGQPRDMA